MISKYEQETIINYNEAEKTASVYTHNKRLIKRLSEFSKKFKDLFQIERVEGKALTFIVPKKYIHIRKPKEANIKQDTK